MNSDPSGADLAPLPCSAIVLAGGQSSRMGRDKSQLPWHGKTLIVHIVDQLRPMVDELLISANDPMPFAGLGLPVLADREPGGGPLQGIAAGLGAARYEWLFVTGCDVPEIRQDFLRRMWALTAEAEVVVPVDASGRAEPLFALYRRSALPVVEHVLASGRPRIIDLFPSLRVCHPELPEGWLKNLNTPEDYAAALHASRPVGGRKARRVAGCACACSERGTAC